MGCLKVIGCIVWICGGVFMLLVDFNASKGVRCSDCNGSGYVEVVDHQSPKTVTPKPEFEWHTKRIDCPFCRGGKRGEREMDKKIIFGSLICIIGGFSTLCKKQKVNCPNCGGSGWVTPPQGGSQQQCVRCQGTGQIKTS